MENKRLVVHCKKEPYDVYIGRGSKWGNPFSHRKGTLAKVVVESREEAIRMYRLYLWHNAELLASREELRGKVLGCWCKPLACHGDILAEWANE